MTAKKQEVAKKEAAAVEPAGFDYGEAAGKGFEDTTAADLSVPFLSILQANSPQVADENPKGAKQGQLFNTVTKELIEGDAGIVFMPCHKEGPVWVEWVPRTAGGGFVGLHAPESPEVEAAKQAEPILNDQGKPTRKLRHGDNELIETYYVYGLVLDAEGTNVLGFAVISFTSTKIKPYRDWITSMYMIKGKPPIFANRARISTNREKNEYGTFFNFQIEPLRETWTSSLVNPVEERELLQEGMDFAEMVVSGMARAAYESQDAAGGGGDDSDGKVPF